LVLLLLSPGRAVANAAKDAPSGRLMAGKVGPFTRRKEYQ
jgi:hypothetical protein